MNFDLEALVSLALDVVELCDVIRVLPCRFNMSQFWRKHVVNNWILDVIEISTCPMDNAVPCPNMVPNLPNSLQDMATAISNWWSQSLCISKQDKESQHWLLGSHIHFCGALMLSIFTCRLWEHLKINHCAYNGMIWLLIYIFLLPLSLHRILPLLPPFSLLTHTHTHTTLM